MRISADADPELRYTSNEYYGENSDGVLYSGIVVFMIIGLQQSVPIVVKTCPETSIDGNWLSKEMDDCITKLSKYGFKVRALVADNPSSNVKAFSNLVNSFNGEQIFIHHPAYAYQLKTYLFCGTIPLLVRIKWALPMHYPGNFRQYTQDIIMEFLLKIHYYLPTLYSLVICLPYILLYLLTLIHTPLLLAYLNPL